LRSARKTSGRPAPARRWIWTAGLLALALPIGVSALTGSGAAHGPGGEPSPSFEAYQAGEVHARFQDLVNPLTPNEAHVRAGQRLYAENCVLCHGPKAEGGGEMAAGLAVPPPNLPKMLRHYPDLDGYYFYIISQGSEPFGRPMPAYADVLTEKEIWQLVLWMQAGFPGAGATGGPVTE
jgi:mono/diheme cytochrome c family protein